VVEAKWFELLLSDSCWVRFQSPPAKTKGEVWEKVLRASSIDFRANTVSTSIPEMRYTLMTVKELVKRLDLVLGVKIRAWIYPSTITTGSMSKLSVRSLETKISVPAFWGLCVLGLLKEDH